VEGVVDKNCHLDGWAPDDGGITMRVAAIIASLPSLSRDIRAAVKSAEWQTHQVDIIVDTGSGGVSASRNRAASTTDADVLAFLDDDDTWLPNHVAENIAVLKDASFSSYGTGGVLHLHDDHVINIVVHGFSVTPGSGLLVRRDAFIAVGGFDESLQVNEVFDLCVKLLKHGFSLSHCPVNTWVKARSENSISRPFSGSAHAARKACLQRHGLT